MIMDVSYYHNLIATATSSHQVMVYDFEFMKINCVIELPDRDI